MRASMPKDFEAGQRGLLVRHLVLPGGIAGNSDVLAFLANEISRRICVNLMDQYRPGYRVDACPELDRPITRSQYREALAAAEHVGLAQLDRRGKLRR
jgi:putative pyruvate formate lyase activating enzyme